jgi:ankyrin repeat protein
MCEKDNPSPEIIKLILEYGANPNNKPRLGEHPLLSICGKVNPSVACVKLLLEYKADPNMKTYFNSTLLHRICLHKSPSLEIIKLIVNEHIHQEEDCDFQNRLTLYVQKIPTLHDTIFTYLLCLKRNQDQMTVKVPKFINFKIYKELIQELITMENIHNVLTAKNDYSKTVLDIALEKDHQMIIFYLNDLQNAFNQ